MKNDSMNKAWVSASQISQVCFCPHSLSLKSTGYQPSAKAQAQMRKGLEEHAKLNQQVRTAAQDKRCYVATHLYGPEDWRTQRLRLFRDTSLKSSRWGRAIISAYYQFSPIWVRICRRWSWADRLTRRCVDKMLYMLMQRNQRCIKGQSPNTEI